MGALGYGARAVALAWGILTLAAAGPAAAETLTLSWDPSPSSNVAGYAVFVSTQPGPGGTAYDAGLQTSFTWNNASPGQQYYFCVAAYAAGQVFGPCSTQISRYPNLAPTLQNPGARSSVIGTNVSLQLVGSDPERAPLTFGASGLPPGLQVAASSGLISGVPTTAGSYVVTATVSDGALAHAETFTWTITASAPTVTTPPTTTTPTEDDEPTSGTGSTSGSVDDTSRDSTTDDTPTSSRDTIAPAISITVPTASESFTTERLFVTIGGSASDNVAVRGVTWTNDRGGGGTATGTELWLAAIRLVKGPNTITVRASDAAGNSTVKKIYVKVLKR